MTQLTLSSIIPEQSSTKHHREFTTWRAACEFAMSLPLGTWEVSMWLQDETYHVKAVRL